MLLYKIVVIEVSKDSGAIFIDKYGIKYKKEVYVVLENINSKTILSINMLIKVPIKTYLSYEDIVSN